MNKLFIILKYSGAIVTVMALAKAVPANATEYVFSAPPEVDNQIVEIPTQEDDYPFYECDLETAEKQTTETDYLDSNTKIDSHDCDCLDCESLVEEEVEEQTKLSSRNKQKK